MSIKDKLITISENMPKVYEAGHKEGYNERNEEVEALNNELETVLSGGNTGYKSYYHEFWDNFQDYGNRRYYYYCFINAGGYWNKQTFKPKYDIILEGNASYAFYAWENCPEDIDIGAILKEQGVTIDTSKATNLGSLFNSGRNIIGELPTISCESAGANTAGLFRSAKVTKIEKLIVTELTVYNNTFRYCSLLEDIVFEGTIANTLSMSDCTHLSKASIESVITHLSDTTSGLTVTLSKTAVNNAFETSEWNALIATKPNWTISLV